ncbi:MAG: glycosyltransferase family 1 protein [Bacteroidota bacterium]
MRIAVNTRFLLKGKMEGFGRFTQESMSRIVRQHPEHEFLFFFDRPYDEQFLFADNVQGFNLFPPARHPVLFLAWFEGMVAHQLHRQKADVFLSPDGFCSLRTSTPTLLVVHDISFKHYPEYVPFVERQYYDRFMPRFIQKARRVATVSEYSKQDIAANYSISTDKIDVVYNGVNPEFIPLSGDAQQAVRDQFSNGQPFFLYVGSVHPRKNVSRLIQAFDQFKQQSGSPMQLLLGGRMAWQTSDVEQVFRASPHQSDIHFLGRLSQADLIRLTASAFALTYVSILEGFGIPILEAMQCHTPVITSNVTSMPEVAGNAAQLVDPFSVDSIAQGMLHMWQDATFREQCIATGQEQLKQFSWAQTADRLWASLMRTHSSEV